MDPDYEEYGVTPTTSGATSRGDNVKKISDILQTHIATEIEGLESDILEMDKRLNETRLILDRLRAAMLISYYKQAESSKTDSAPTSSGTQQGIHPAVKTGIGKSIPATESALTFKPATTQSTAETQVKSVTAKPKLKLGKSKHRVVVGNVSKYIPVDTRQRNDQSTHKWMVYVRGPRENPNISHIVKKVWFFLHPSYKPNDLVEVTSSPFHLTRRGWGEFPIRVQLHLNDAKGRKVDIIHMLKLDRTYSGEQSLGAETHVDVELEPPGDDSDIPQKSSRMTPKVVPTSPAPSTDSAIRDTTIRHPSPQKPVHSNTNEDTLQPNKKHSLDLGEGHGESSSNKLRIVEVKTESTAGLLSQPLLASSVLNVTSVQTQKSPAEGKDPRVNTNMQSLSELPLRKKSVNVGNLTTNQLKGIFTSEISTPSKTYSVVAAKVTNSHPHLLPAVKAEAGTVSGIVVKPVAPTNRVSLLNSRSTILRLPAPTLPNGLPVKLASQTASTSHGAVKPQQVSLLRQPSISTSPGGLQTISSNSHSPTPLQTTADTLSKPTSYVKCVLSDGRLLLFKKIEGNKNGLSKDTKMNVAARLPSLPGVPSNATSGIVSQSTEPRLHGISDSKKKSQPAPVPMVTNHTPPTVDMLPDIETLLRHLALMYPLLCTGQDRLLQLRLSLPSYTDYINWPLGKRRAREWQRAKDIHRHLIKYKQTFDVQPWTTKNIVIWLRRHLYTPLCEEDTLFPLPEAIASPPPSSHLGTLAKQLINDDSKSIIEPTEEVIDITADIKVEKMEVADEEKISFRTSLLSESESAFISTLTSQVGAKLDQTELSKGVQADLSAYILHKLYMTFMEHLIRSSYASKPPVADRRLAADDVYRAMSTCETFQFLDNNFIDEATKTSK